MEKVSSVRKFTLQGLHCANCAAKIERAAGEIDGVLSANLVFISQTLSVEVPDDFKKDLHKKIDEIVKKFEPDVLVSEDLILRPIERENGKHFAEGKAWLVRIIITGLLLGAGIYLGGDSVLGTVILLSAYALIGYDILFRAAKNISRGVVFNENFLMALATVGAIVLGEYAEAVAVMLFYQVGEFFQSGAVAKSKKSISDLMDIRPDYANMLKGGKEERVSPETVSVGDIIIVKPGEKIPLDGIVREGTAFLDTTALTGESVPRKASVGDGVLSGSINKDSVLKVEVTKIYGESTVAKIIDLVENAASKKAKTEKFITKFAKYYTPAVVALAALLVIVPPLFFGGEWADWARRGLIFLVISCPCALVLSIPLSFFGGIGSASKKGILVKGGNFLEALSNTAVVAFDKTGTLTKGVFKVTNIQPAENFTKDGLLKLAASAEAFSSHPIAKSILKEYNHEIDGSSLKNYKEEAGLGVSVSLDGFRVYAGNGSLMDKLGVKYKEAETGGTVVYVAADKQFAGSITISDEVREDSRAAIAELKKLGVKKTIMLTGDNKAAADAVAAETGVDEVYYGLLPGGKVDKLEMISATTRAGGAGAKKESLVFIGDGINDAPVLAMADVGVAMGGLGADSAIEAADVVLMTDEPLKLAKAIEVARFTKRVVWQNIIFSLGVKGIFMILGAFDIATMWEAVFADVGVSLIAVLNAARIIRMR